jgi:hypothetical protein
MIMMPYRSPRSSPQLTGLGRLLAPHRSSLQFTGQADFWHPTRAAARGTGTAWPMPPRRVDAPRESVQVARNSLRPRLLP